jgi:hypothetical protein
VVKTEIDVHMKKMIEKISPLMAGTKVKVTPNTHGDKSWAEILHNTFGPFPFEGVLVEEAFPSVNSPKFYRIELPTRYKYKRRSTPSTIILVFRREEFEVIV